MSKVDLPAQPQDLKYAANGRLYVALIDGSVGYVQPNALTDQLEYFDSVFFDEEQCVRTIDINGNSMACGLSDGMVQICDLSKESVIASIDKVEKDSDVPVAPSKTLWLNETLLAVGYDSGVVLVYDTANECKILREYEENEDYITDMFFHAEKKRLFVAGGDGFFTVLDPRKSELVARSDNFECELHSICPVSRSGKEKVLVGFDDGVIGIFDDGDWGDIRNRVKLVEVVDEDEDDDKEQEKLVVGMFRYQGDSVMVCRSDGVWLLDARNKSKKLDLKEFKNDIEFAALSSDSKYLALCYVNDDVWIFDTEELLAQETAAVLKHERDQDSDSEQVSQKKKKAKKQKIIKKPVDTSFFNDLV